MAIVAFTDIGSIVIVLIMMVVMDAFGYVAGRSIFCLMAGLLGMFATAWTFTNGYVVQSTAYNAGSSAFVSNNVDPNLMVVVLAVMTIFSFLFVYLEYSRGDE